jgi:hypothetical protein
MSRFLLLLAASLLVAATIYQRRTINDFQTRTELLRSRFTIAFSDNRNARRSLQQLEMELSRKVPDPAPVPASVAPPIISAPDPVADREVVWVENKPYFYMQKKYLKQIKFAAVGSDFDLEEEARSLLNISPIEARQVNALLQKFHDDFLNLEKAHFRSISPNPTSANGKLMYHLDALGPEVKALQGKLETDVTEVLGSQRWDLLAAQVNWREVLHEFDEDERTFTVEPGENAKYTVKTKSGSYYSSGGVPPEWFHLFPNPNATPTGGE